MSQAQASFSGVAAGAPIAAQGMQEVMQQMVERQRAILEGTKKLEKKLTLIDNRGLAKPSNLNGDADFLQWKIRLEAFVASIHADMEDVMLWAEEEEADPITRAGLTAASDEVNPSEHQVDDLDDKQARMLCFKRCARGERSRSFALAERAKG